MRQQLVERFLRYVAEENTFGCQQSHCAVHPDTNSIRQKISGGIAPDWHV